MATVLTCDQMLAELAEAFPSASMSIEDASYAVVARESVAELGRFLSQVLAGLKIREWKDFFDCDDFARMAHVFACVMHRKARMEGLAPDAQAPAFGVVLYEHSRKGGHAVNWVRTEKGIELWEPQDQVFQSATAEERRSAWSVFC